MQRNVWIALNKVGISTSARAWTRNSVVLRALMLAMPACGHSSMVDATTDVASEPEAGADRALDANAVDAADGPPADRPRIDDFVFNDVVDESDHDAGGGMETGQLVGGTGALPGPIAGLHYTMAGVSDVTDSTGMFHYTPGAMVTFQIADVTFLPTAGRHLLSPFQIAATGTCVHSTELEKALVLLYSLDADGDPTTGTTLPSYPTMAPARRLSDLSLADIATLVNQLIPGRTPLTPEEATDRFIREIDDEAWIDTGLDTFALFVAVTRGQGLATDGVDVYFSATDGLERTDAMFNREIAAYGAIPTALHTMYGSDHIGDIDVWNGSLYAPVEDGPAYANPLVVIFDPVTLTAGSVFQIPNTLQTEGVPWVAVNGPANELYLAQWDPTPQLNIFSLATVTYERSVPLRPPVGRIQGAKMFDGALYMSSDDANKSVFKVNIETGTVLHLFDIPITSENEGLAFFMMPDGSEMHTLNVSATIAGSELRHHHRSRDPLRHLICP